MTDWPQWTHRPSGSATTSTLEHDPSVAEALALASFGIAIWVRLADGERARRPGQAG
jgi:hypothetical protein